MTWDAGGTSICRLLYIPNNTFTFTSVGFGICKELVIGTWLLQVKKCLIGTVPFDTVLSYHLHPIETNKIISCAIDADAVRVCSNDIMLPLITTIIVITSWLRYCDANHPFKNLILSIGTSTTITTAHQSSK